MYQVWPTLTEVSKNAVRNTIPKLKIESDNKKHVRMLKCIGKKCQETGKKHREDEMWLHILNPYTINKKSAKRFCNDCAKTYDGKYILEKPKNV